MRRISGLHFAAAILLGLAACRVAPATTITVLDGESVITLQTRERVPLLFLTDAGIEFSSEDRLFLNGVPIAPDEAVEPQASMTVQIRRPVELTVLGPQGEQVIRTAELTVAGAIREQGIDLRAGDFIDPAADTIINGPMAITYRPGRDITVSIGGQALSRRTSVETIGEALAEAGLPLVGADYSVPAENEPVPGDGQIRVVRVAESLVLALKPIPFTSEYREAADVELGVEEILQPGRSGLAMSRTRIRYEDGQEVSRVAETESIVRAPQTRIAARGTKIVVKAASVDGVAVEYWRVLEMYATSYSPCRSGVQGQCFTGTSLGLPVKKGVVAVDITFYNQMAGQQVYVAGYGPAVIADVGAGRIVEANLGIPRTRWIDLGYSDSDWQQWGQYVTVYFLPPAPGAIPSVLQ